MNVGISLFKVKWQDQSLVLEKEIFGKLLPKHKVAIDDSSEVHLKEIYIGHCVIK